MKSFLKINRFLFITASVFFVSCLYPRYLIYPTDLAIKAVDIETYRNGKVRRCFLIEDWLSPDGTPLKAGTVVEFHPSGCLSYFISSGLEKDSVVGASHLSGHEEERFKNGKPKRFSLKDDFTAPNGMTFKSGTEIIFHSNGKCCQGFLRKDWKSPDNPDDPTVKGNTTVFLHRNGKLHRFVCATQWDFSTAVAVSEKSTVECFPSGKLQSFTLARDWSPSDDLELPAGSRVILHKNGKFKTITTSRNFGFRNKAVAKEGTVIKFFPNGNLREYTLGEQWWHPGGMKLKAGTKVLFFRNGMPEQLTLAEKFNFPGALPISADSVIRFYENGTIEKAVIANTFSFKGGLSLKANSAIRFYPNGNLKTLVLDSNWSIPNLMTCQGGTELSFFINGDIRKATIDETWKEIRPISFFPVPDAPSIFPFPEFDTTDTGKSPVTRYFDNSARKTFPYYRPLSDVSDTTDTSYVPPSYLIGTEIEYFSNRRVKHCTYATDITDSTGIIIKAGRSAAYFENGSLRKCTLAKNWDHPSGVRFKAGSMIRCNSNGTIIAGTCAKRYRKAGMNITRGAPIAIFISETDTVEVVGSKIFMERIKKGIHVVSTPNNQLMKKIKSSRTDLWSFWNNDIYQHFDSIREMDNILKKKTFPLKPGEQSDPFEFKENVYLIQKML